MDMNTNINTITTTDRNDATDPLISNGAIQAWPELKNILTSESSWRSRIPVSPTKIQWPEPELCIGLPCCSLGRHKCWEVVGPARDISQAIFRATKDLLDQHSEYLHETEKVPFSIMFGLYMIGRNEKKSSPTLLLSCEPKKPRTKALKLVRESGILQDFPGVLLAESSQAPTALGHVRALGNLSAADADFVFFSPPTLNNVCGRSIFAMESSDPDNLAVTSVSRKATIGGFVRLRNSEYDNVYCGLTVAHAFEDELKATPVSTDVEFAFDGSDGEEEDDTDETESHSDSCMAQNHLESELHFVGQRSKLRSMLHAPVDSQIYRGSIRNAGHGIGCRIATSLDGEHPDLDWALIEVQQPHTQPANVISVDRKTGQCLLYVERIVPSISENVNVLVVTSSGVRTAVLSASSTFFKSEYGCSFEEVFTVRLDGNVNRGDSGSWVIDPEKGNLYGHIVAGCPESRVGYLVPASRIFSDIRRQLGGIVELAAINKDSSATALSSTDPAPADSKLGPDHIPLPLGMSQDAGEVINRFGISNEIFAQMAIETDLWYQSLIVNPSNLKPYVKKPTPYSWPDISDKAIYECIINICSKGSEETQPFWDKGFAEQGECPNWIARWFLYRRFKLATTSQQKRFSDIHPQDLDYMFVAHTEHAKGIETGNKVLPIPSRTSNRSTRGSSSSVPEALVGRGKLYEGFSSNISVSERDILEEASVTE